MKAEEFYKNHELKDELSFSQLTSTGISTNYNQVFAFAEAYHQSRVKPISDEAQKGIDEFTDLRYKYPRIATIDVIKLLERLKLDLLKQ